MQDEDIDKIIREAASQHHPPYDDTAWDKMEQLLDKHLPQKKERKRPYFLLLAFLLAGGGFYTFIYPGINLSGSKSIGSIAQNDKSHSADNSGSLQTDKESIKTGETGVSIKARSTGTDTVIDIAAGPSANNIKRTVTGVVASDDNYSTHGGVRVNKKGKVVIHIKNATASDINSDDAMAVQPHNKKQIEADEAEEKNDELVANKKIVTVTTGKNVSVTQNEMKKEADAPKPDLVIRKENKTEPDKTLTAVKKKEDKNKVKVPGNFGITASAGTDLSFVDIGSLGKATFMYGAGVSYDVSRRFKLRAGFYVSRKIYDAAPSEYNGVQYPYLNDVNGNCKVYEIPVSVNYNFGAAKKHNWFAGVGLSSFVMKKEDYTYNYKTPSGSYTYNQEINNQNKHLFSVLSLSAGYQYDLNNRVSLMAEPFIKLPLTGLGEGKIKLNSTGILLTATVKPFNKKKK